MASEKYNLISALSKATAEDVTSSPVEWTKFLRTASRVYRYPYEDQLLIYAQRPDATACASIDIWNNRMHCWVNRGAKGIALIDEEGQTYTGLKYVFDVSDVHPSRNIGRLPNLWEMSVRHEDAVIDALEKTYGRTTDFISFEDRVSEMAHRVARDYTDMALPDVLYARDSSLLEGLDDAAIERHFRVTLGDTVAFMLLERCGYDPSFMAEGAFFNFIHEFSTPETAAVLGNAASDLARPMLMQIGRTIEAFERDARNAGRDEKTVANDGILHYNALKRESADRDIQTAEAEETIIETGTAGEGSAHGADIRTERGLSDTEPHRAEAARGDADEVRNPQEGLPEEPPQGSVLGILAERDTEGALPAGAGRSDRQDGDDDRENGTERGRDGEPESGGPDGLASEDGIHQEQGGGDSIERPGLQPVNAGSADTQTEELTADIPEPEFVQMSLFPTVSEQAGTIAAAVAGEKLARPAAFSLSGDQLDDILRSGGGRADSRKRIYAKYQAGRSPEAMALFLQAEYGTTGKGFMFGDDPVSVWFDAEGMKAGYGRNTDDAPLMSLTWADIEARIRSMVESGTYMSRTEAFMVDLSEKERVANRIYYFFREGIEEVPASLEIPSGGFPEAIDRLTALLYTQEGIALLTDEVNKSKEQLENGEKEIRWRYVAAPNELLAELADMEKEPLEFPLPDTLDVMQEDFITQDEIDHLLTGGSNVHDSQFRIYEYYQMEHSPKEAADFLKNEYGTGGRTSALPGNDSSYEGHDAKGITLEKGSIMEPYTSVTLKWNVVEKRVRELIAEDKYLTPEGKEAFARYKEAEAMEAMRREQSALDAAEESGTDQDKNTVKTTAEAPDETRTAELQEEIAELREMNRAYQRYLEDPGIDETEKSEYRMKLRANEEAISGLEAEAADIDPSVTGNREKFSRLDDPAGKTQEHIVTFYVSESSEVHTIGGFYEGIQSLEEAVHIYEQLRENSTLNGVPALGINLHKAGTDTIEDEQWDFVRGGRLDSEGLVFVPEMADNPEIMDALQRLSEIYPYEETDQLVQTEQIDQVGQSKGNMEAGHQNTDPYQVGDSIKIDGTEFVIEEVRAHEIVMRDPTLLYPVSRVEPRENLERLLEAEEPAVKETVIDLTPKETQESASRNTEARNFRITDDDLGVGGAKEKFRRNMEAIYLLKTLENENRQASPEEQEVLSRYVGWGGLADAFDPDKRDWTMQYQELAAALTPEEYNAARASTLNAHYTSPVVIKAMYEAVGNMGFTKGNILEPSCGVGNFLGLLPDEMRGSRLYGVELDSISGRIAKQLYPESDITVGGFETTDRRDFYDLAIGNVPFGNYKVNDKPYNKLNFNIHNYFFAKALDQVRPGGVVAFVTSRYTMDSASEEVRRYLAQRAELLGAVRLPNNAFKANAGTDVVSDIIFLQKRDRVMDIEPDWVHRGLTDQGHEINSYFTEHPGMVLGDETEESTQYGRQDYTVKPIEGADLAEQLKDAMRHITGRIDSVELESDDLENDGMSNAIPADPTVRNFSFCMVDDTVYYRENSMMAPANVSETQLAKIKGMIAIRDCMQELISMQLDEVPDALISEKQDELNNIYDDFTRKHGLINSQGNKRLFSQDASYCLLCSLEKLDDEGNFIGKADMFSKRTIKRAEAVEHVDTASEALAVSLSEKAKVDLEYMAGLSGKTEKELTDELAGVIFKNPVTERWETADEYLSGNVREKLKTATELAENSDEYAVNVQALTRVQPKALDASEIEVRIGATWIDPKYIEDFMRDTFQTPSYLFRHRTMAVQYSDVTGQWNVKGKNQDFGNSLANVTYGTGRVSAYKILEDSLNLKDTRIYDTVIEDGKEKRVLNKKETTLASQKQEAIREAFKDWVFSDAERREALVNKYNELFNSTRPREYDGSHLTFPGMTPDIELKPHQLNAVAHVLYGNNTLLAHAVGAGKTFEMTAAAMESKRLGLCRKSLFVVPNHLTEQWASDFLRLYPGANILAATRKDFEPANRKKFCSRIATGDYDAVIIGHSQFEKIPLSDERQAAIIQKQIDDIETAIATAKAERGERYTIKQMEKSKRSLETKLQKLNDKSRKDNVVTFEQLGVDHLYVDESHNYKNLFLYTKMRNVAGIAQTEAQKSQDMWNKCRYLDELTGGKGVTFATGTPISNSMCELYTNMRYLQYDTLQKLGLGQFDSWAATFGETQTAIELAPEGTGYRAKTRFSKFFNLPELIALFKEAADIQTADMLDLDIPEVDYENVVLKPSEAQKEMVQSLADRAERVRNRMVDSSVDNMLKITNDGRKLALDQRLINDMLSDSEDNKSSACVDRAFRIWQDTAADRSTQAIFCDLSTPKGDGSFSVYEDIRDKLIAKGVPPEEIAFIHDANTETKKAELFAKVRSGQVRFLLGSTAKMGAGTNVQNKLIALHHLDVPWRPSDIEQQEGRILRQGNDNDRVKIFRYVTEGTFDAYSWQLIENKQKFISQIMTSKSPVRSCEDIDESTLTYAEVKALATGNPYIKEKMTLDTEVARLKLMKSNHTSQIYRLEDNIAKNYPRQITVLQERIEGYKADVELYRANKPADKESFSMTVAGKAYAERKEAGAALIEVCREMKHANTAVPVGEYLGMQMSVSFDFLSKKFDLTLKGKISHSVELGADPSGNITRIGNLLEGMEGKLAEAEAKLANVEQQLETAKEEVRKPFAQEAELKVKLERLAELNALLNMDEKGDDVLDVDEDAVRADGRGDEAMGQDEAKEAVIAEDVEKADMTEAEVVAADMTSADAVEPGITEPDATEPEKMAAVTTTLEEAREYVVQTDASQAAFAADEIANGQEQGQDKEQAQNQVTDEVQAQETASQADMGPVTSDHESTDVEAAFAMQENMDIEASLESAHAYQDAGERPPDTLIYAKAPVPEPSDKHTPGRAEPKSLRERLEEKKAAVEAKKAFAQDLSKLPKAVNQAI